MGPGLWRFAPADGILASMSPGSLFALARRLRSERGQTSAEYVGILVVVCAIVVVLLNAGIGDLLAAKLKAQIALVATDQESGGGGSSNGGDASGGSGGSNEGGDASGGSGGSNDSGSGGPVGGAESGDGTSGAGRPPGAGREQAPGAGGGKGMPGGGSAGGANQAPGAPSAQPLGGTHPGGQASTRDKPSPWPCLSATFGGIHGCATAALGLPAYLSKKNGDTTAKALARTERWLEKAEPGSRRAAFLTKLQKRQQRALETARSLEKNRFVRGGNRLSKIVNTSATDVGTKLRDKAGLSDENKRFRQIKAPSSAPSSRSAARGVLSASRSTLGRVVKGAGILGTAVGAYGDVKKDGLGKGLTKTAAGVGASYATGAAVAAGCAAVGLATLGVGAVACGAVAIGASVVTSKYAKDAAGWAYDHAPQAARAVKDFAGDAIRAETEAITHPVKTVAAGAKRISEGLDDVGSALNPFG